MKKVIIASAVAAALGFASMVGAANYVFSNYLTVGSTGADVSALQTWLISSGFDIAAITSGVAQKGYFGQQTKAAVVKYQASVGLPSTGFVGPLTVAKLNGSAVAMTPAMGCPVGYTCTPVAGTPTGAPAAPGTISTPGTVGTLAYTLYSTPSGIEAYKGQAYDVAGYKAQASASDMAIQNLTLDFDVRLWLYASTITLRDDSGSIIGKISNLSQGNFSELTAGSVYRVSVPVNNYVVRATQTRYITVNLTFLPSSDRSSGTITFLQSQVRSIDGTGVSDTQTELTDRTFHYNGSGVGSIVVTTNPNSPATGLVQVSTSAQTPGVILAKYDIKSQSAPSTLQSFSIDVQATGVSGITPATLFGNVQLSIGGQTLSPNTTTSGSGVGGIASTTYTFNNFAITLPADQYVTATIMANVAVDTSGTTISGASASTTLKAIGTTNGTSNNPAVIDQSYSTVDVNEATFTSNSLTFTSSSVIASALGVTYGTAINNTTTGSSTQQFSFVFSLTAGNNPIYVSKISPTALATTTADPSGMVVTRVNFSDNDTNGDSTGTSATDYFYLAPGQTKTFTAVYSATGLTANGGTIQVNSIKYGTASTNLVSGSLTQSTIQNALKAILYH